jgi:type I restriction enzyme, S subunit
MNDAWPTVRLADLAAPVKGAIAGGPFGSDLVSADYVNEGVPVIRGVNLPFGRKIDLDNVVFVSEAKADSLHLNCAAPGDLVFTQRGTLGQVGLLPKHPRYSRYLISQSQMKMTVDPGKASALYLYHYFRLPSSVAYIENHALQSGVPHINLGILRKLEVILPPLPVQQRIAAVLEAYDDLITNNQRRIALLESMAEEIYREWFVRMRFPQRAPLKGDELMPPGWSRQPIGELAVLIKRGISPDYAERSEHQVINQKCIRGGRLSMAEARPHTSVVPDEKLLRFGDILINSTGVGTLGRAAVCDIAADGVTCDSHVTILRPKDVAHSGEFLAYTIQLLQTYFESMASGSTGQAELSRELISRTKVLVPTPDLLKRFSEATAPIRKQRRLLLDQNEKLSALRDQLLPRLISGKLRVEALDIQFPPSMQPPPAEAAQPAVIPS